MISILAVAASFGGAYNVKKAFTTLDETVLLCGDYLSDVSKGRPKDTVDAIITPENAKKWARVVRASRFVFLVGASAITVLGKLPGYKKWAPKLNSAVWVTDSYYLGDPDRANRNFKILGVKNCFILASDCLWIAPPPGSVPLEHPISLLYPGKKDPKQVLVMHSPGTRYKRKQKRSDDIEEVIKELQKRFNFDYECLMGIPHQACLEKKAEAHIFIDKIRGYSQGIGKSGLEAMASEAVVLSAVARTRYIRRFFKNPPVFKVHSKYRLKQTLINLLKRQDLIEKGRISREWIVKYWGLENGAWLRYFRRYTGL